MSGTQTLDLAGLGGTFHAKYIRNHHGIEAELLLAAPVGKTFKVVDLVGQVPSLRGRPNGSQRQIIYSLLVWMAAMQNPRIRRIGNYWSYERPTQSTGLLS